jgi:hypothetical protein
MTVPGSTGEVLWILDDLRASEGCGTPGGVVKCVDIRKNTKGEGSILGSI